MSKYPGLTTNVLVSDMRTVWTSTWGFCTMGIFLGFCARKQENAEVIAKSMLCPFLTKHCDLIAFPIEAPLSLLAFSFPFEHLWKSHWVISFPSLLSYLLTFREFKKSHHLDPLSQTFEWSNKELEIAWKMQVELSISPVILTNWSAILLKI